MSSTFGSLFKVTTFGESHSKGVGAVVDGCPSNLSLSEADIQKQLDRRKPGQSRLTTQRKEADQVTILSGVENNLTLGTPIGMFILNQDQRPGDYDHVSEIPRPSHGDYTYQMKYGIRAVSGGGRASARETTGRVAAGAVAEIYLAHAFGVEIVAWVSAVGTITAPDPDVQAVSRERVDESLVRCPDSETSVKMVEAIEEVKFEKDSLGGIITCVCRNVPAGWGEPVFDKAEAKLAQAMLSIPAAKGFEIGSGFAGTRMRGSAHNDRFVQKGDRLGTLTNFSGGIQAGITNGEPVVFNVAFKPTATIGTPQETADFAGNIVSLAGKGRHDPCVLPRAVPIVEAMAAMVLADLALIQETRK
ncbi:MAG: chorismate synthase [Proteobacteria bacterium]|nr:chorismate synthase [Pseudomonadota bacterium]MBU4469485.1 chorismate synthase [Pseudomonadota bacterium]MCG2752384.1 chorismate synthase [Desulfobacteraceae bacterium]